jgi:hypothetical protein
MAWVRALFLAVATVARVVGQPSGGGTTSAPGSRVQSDMQGAEPSVKLSVVSVSTDKSGYETFRVSAQFGPRATSVYALYGEPGAPLEIPPAFQVAPPFGSDIGPVDAAFLPLLPDAQFDSWLTIGTDGPALIKGALSTVGLPLDAWSEDVGFCADNGAVRDSPGRTAGVPLSTQRELPAPDRGCAHWRARSPPLIAALCTHGCGRRSSSWTQSTGQRPNRWSSRS